MAKMTRAEFAERVKAHEVAAQQDPSGYRQRVISFVVLGYAFLLAVLLGTIGLMALLIFLILHGGRIGGGVIKLLLILGVFLFVLLRSLWVKFDKPTGIRLTRENAGPLFAVVDRMTDTLKAPRFHHILLDGDFNAAVFQRPRLGIFGWQENYLMVGLPLMTSLPPEQLEAVLAHELGHLRGGHGAFGAWIYRVNATWARLLSQLENGNGGNLFTLFFSWYYPRFNALSFVLRRTDEYEADRCAAQLTSSRTTADALCAVQVRGHVIENTYWKSVYDSVQERNAPPTTAFTDMRAALRPSTEDTAEEAKEERYLQDALREETGYSDTHPSLTDRLKSLGEEAHQPQTPERTAAEYFFGPHLEALTHQLDKEWQENIAPAWHMRFEQVKEQKNQLAALEQRVTAGETLPTEEAWQRAAWTEEFVSEDAALPLYQELMTQPETATIAQFSVGRLLLSKDNPEGIRHLEAVVAKDYEATLAALGLIYEYYKRQGDDAAAKAVYARGISHADREDDASEERSTLGTQKTIYLPADLSPEIKEKMRQQLAAIEDIAEAYVVRKPLVYFPEKPLYILGVTLTHYWRRTNAEKDTATVIQRIHESVEFSGETLFAVMHNELNWLHKSVKQAPDSLIFHREN